VAGGKPLARACSAYQNPTLPGRKNKKKMLESEVFTILAL
jgi:hypothetical protein